MASRRNALKVKTRWHGAELFPIIQRSAPKSDGL